MSHITFPAKYSGETVNEQFDFTSRLAVGETISTFSTVASVYSGIDPSPSSILSGGGSSSNGVVLQAVTGGVTGVTYSLICTANTSAGQTLQISALLSILPSST